jgi:hypothetical protein
MEESGDEENVLILPAVSPHKRNGGRKGSIKENYAVLTMFVKTL